MGAGPILSASPELQKLGYTVSGVVVIDVVEGQCYSPYRPSADGKARQSRLYRS